MAKILVVDDSDDLLDMLGIMLKVKGHTIVTSNDFLGTVKSINSFSPDLIILDVLLGNSDGREICKQIKRFFPALPILLMSASPELLHNFKACNADAVLEKPFEMNVLNQTISALLKTSLQAI
jgi:DNA-binding response OmpR family regulator